MSHDSTPASDGAKKFPDQENADSINQVYARFGRSLSAGYLLLEQGNEPYEVLKEMHQRGLESAFMIVAQVRQRIDHPMEVSECLKNAMTQICGAEFSDTYRREKLLDLFPCLRGEGDAV